MSGSAPPLRVLRIIARLNTGGPAIHAVLLTQGLDPDRYVSELVIGQPSPLEGDMAYFAASRNVTPRVVPDLGPEIAAWKDVKSIVRLLGIMRRFRPDVIHTHTGKAGIVGRVGAIVYNLGCSLARRRRAVLVHTFHGHVLHGYYPRWFSRALTLVERVLAARTDRIVMVSRAVKDEVVAQYRVCPEAKAVVVPLGFDFEWVSRLEGARGGLRMKAGVAPGTVTIGSVGRLVSIKHHELLLRAVARLRARGVATIIVGDGERRQALEAAAADAGLAQAVVFAGWQRDPAAIYADLDVVCLTSKNEGTPVALIEAMAAGRPFVATRVGGVPDLVVGPGVPHQSGFLAFDNGILVPPDDEVALAAALAYLLDRPDLRRAMGEVGRRVAADRFSSARLMRDVDRVYTDLLRETRRGS